jgi:hypothetical protein
MTLDSYPSVCQLSPEHALPGRSLATADSAVSHTCTWRGLPLLALALLGLLAPIALDPLTAARPWLDGLAVTSQPLLQ